MLIDIYPAVAFLDDNKSKPVGDEDKDMTSATVASWFPDRGLTVLSMLALCLVGRLRRSSPNLS